MKKPAWHTGTVLLIATTAVAVGALVVWGATSTRHKEELARHNKKARTATVAALLRTLLQHQPHPVGAHVQREGRKKRQVGEEALPYRVLLDMEQLEHNIKVLAAMCARRGLLQVRLDATSLRFPAIVEHCGRRLCAELHAHNVAHGREADNVLVTIGLSTGSASETAQWVTWLRQQSTSRAMSALFLTVMQLQPSRSVAEGRLFVASAITAAAHDVMCLVAVDGSHGLDMVLRALEEEVEEQVGAAAAALSGQRLSLVARIEANFPWWERTLLYSFVQQMRRRRGGNLSLPHVRSPADVEQMRTLVHKYNTVRKRGGQRENKPRVALEGVLFGEREDEHTSRAPRHIGQSSEDVMNAMQESKMASLWTYLRKGNPFSKWVRRWQRSEVALRHRRLLEWYYLKNLSWGRAAMDTFFISDPHCMDEVLTEAAMGEDGGAAASASLRPEVHLGAAQLLGSVDYYVEGMCREVGPALFVTSVGASGTVRKDEVKEWEEVFPTILVPTASLFLMDNTAKKEESDNLVLYTPLSAELCLQQCSALYGVKKEEGQCIRMTTGKA